MNKMNSKACVLFLLLCWRDPADAGVSLVVTPNTAQFLKDEPISILCEEEEEGADEEELQLWKVMKNRNEEVSVCVSPGAGPGSYAISRARPSDSAIYWCQSVLEETSNYIHIIVTDGHVILESPALPVPEGHHVTLSCRTAAPPPHVVLFYKDGVPLEAGLQGSRLGAGLGTRLALRRVTRTGHEGLYRCSVGGLTSPESWLAVATAPPPPPAPPPATCHFLPVTGLLLSYAVVILPFLLSTVWVLLIYRDIDTGRTLPLPSGRRLRSIRTKTSLHLNSFFPTATGLINKARDPH